MESPLMTATALQSTTVAELARLVAHIGRKAPELDSRAERAALILLRAKLAPIGPDTFEVAGGEPGPYVVDGLGETCSCKDFQHRAPEYQGGRWCKHLLAVLMYRHLSKRGERRRERRHRLATYRASRRRVRVPLLGRLAVA